MSASSKKQLRKEQKAAAKAEKLQAEQKEAKKLKLYSIVFMAVIALVICVAIAIGVVTTYNTSGIVERNTVALTVNDHEISNADLSYYYVDGINNTYNSWYQSYGEYTASFVQLANGLDLSKPLNEQTYLQDGSKTWADYFVEMAIEDAKSAYALYDAAIAAGRTISDEEMATLDENIATLESMATVYGYQDLNTYLESFYGFGATEEGYRKYNEITYLASAYYNEYSESLTYDAAAIDAFAKEYPNEYASFDYARYYIAYNKFLGEGTTDEEGNVTHSDEETAAAIEEAKKTAESLATAADLAALNEAILALDFNQETQETATEYTAQMYSELPTTLQEWLSDSSRKAGDIEVIANESTTTDENGKSVTTTFGYYVVVFQNRNDNTTPMVNVRHILSSFEGGTANPDGTVSYSDEEKKAAYDALFEVYSAWKDGDATEESFAQLATENTDDTGSVNNGGLYEDVFPGQMVPAFNDWCFDASRKTGDNEIIETEYGYHLMYYVSQADQTYRDYMITSDMTTRDLNLWMEELVAASNSEVKDTSKLNLDVTISG